MPLSRRGKESAPTPLFEESAPPKVQVHNYHVLTRNLYQNYYYPNPKYSIIGYMAPLGPPRALRHTENHGPVIGTRLIPDRVDLPKGPRIQIVRF